MLDFLKLIRQPTPKFKEMEVEHQELEMTKNDFIAELQDRILEQKKLIASLEAQLAKIPVTATEVTELSVRRKVNTMSELASVMEELSIERKRKNEKNNPQHSS